MQNRRGNRVLRVVLSTTSLILPAITLIPLGSLWLWEHGYLLHWAVMALALVAAGMGLQWWLLREPADQIETAGAPAGEVDVQGLSHEAAARKRLDAYVASLTPDSVKGEQAIRDLAVATINLVAREMHPGETHPHWNFTVPEALLVAERVAARLRPVVIDNVPLGDQLTVRQVLRMYEWRSAVDWAERAYDIWRIVRLLNPAAAITHEARERLTKKLYSSLKDEFTVRLAQGYVREIGAAAIDLYSGRLRVGQHGEKITTNGASEPVETHAPDGFSWSRLGTQAKSVGKFAAQTIFRRK
jgi:hypothetical protein